MRALALMVVVLVTPAAIAAPADHEPAAIVLVVDRTMGAKTDAVRAALADAMAVLAPEDKIGVVGVDAKAQVIVPLQGAKDRDGFARKAAGLGRGRSVNVAAGIEAARAMLVQVKTPRKQIVVITDTTSVIGVSALHGDLKHDGIVVSAIGVESVNRAALATIASKGNGRVHAIEDVTGLGGILRDESTRVLPPSQIALVVVIERSAAMQGPRLEVAKEVSRVAIERVDSDDRVGVVIFDTAASTYIALQKPDSRMRMSAELSRITAGSGSQLFDGLSQAKQMLAGNKLDKRVLLVSLGRGAMDGVAELVEQMATDGITVSVLGVPGAERDALAIIAEKGQGRLRIFDAGVELDAIMRDMNR